MKQVARLSLILVNNKNTVYGTPNYRFPLHRPGCCARWNNPLLKLSLEEKCA
jgi:hypothetical protein